MNCPDCGHANLAGEEICASCHAPVAALAMPHPNQGMQKRILEGTVKDLQPHDATSLPEDSTLEQAIKVMREKKAGCVLLTRAGKLSGIFTERDLLVKSDPAVPPTGVAVKAVMRPDPECLQDGQPLAYAFHTMTMHGVHHLPVRRSDGSLAVVSARDLLRYLCE